MWRMLLRLAPLCAAGIVVGLALAADQIPDATCVDFNCNTQSLKQGNDVCVASNDKSSTGCQNKMDLNCTLDGTNTVTCSGKLKTAGTACSFTIAVCKK